ncbi:hypothetical protein L7F22_007548 [Adiantum nelumboides]|nr:hypothetical protein [Adiantum nelumboides]
MKLRSGCVPNRAIDQEASSRIRPLETPLKRKGRILKRCVFVDDEAHVHEDSNNIDENIELMDTNVDVEDLDHNKDESDASDQEQDDTIGHVLVAIVDSRGDTMPVMVYSRAHVTPNIAHEVYMFQKRGLVNKESILERLTLDMREWAKVEMTVEARYYYGIAPLYNTPCGLISQLWKDNFNAFMSKEAGKLDALGLNDVEKMKRLDKARKMEEERLKDRGYKYLSIANTLNGDEFFKLLYGIKWNDPNTKELSDIGIQCISHYDWHEDPLGTPIFSIPKNEIFHINGVAFEVRLSCIQGAGYGLFVQSAIESGVTILHYGGPKYGFQEWKKICKLIPRAIKYCLVEDPKVEEEEDRAYILGFVEEGNVSGYINSSHCMDFHPNVRYALDPNLPPWYKGISSHIKSEEYGHICIETICRVEPGEELFANYEFT